MTRLALLGGDPIRSQPYAPYNPIGDEEKRRAMAVLDTGLLSGFVGRGNDQFLGGPVVRELEALACERMGVAHAISVSSATSGLHAALVAAGVGPGDEVIVPPYTMSATAMAVMMCGAMPVFADIEPTLFCLDAAKVEAKIGPRTKAVVAVNLFGQPAALAPIRAIADRRGLVMVEDNAQAPAARYHNTLAGTVGHLGVLSLNRHKTMQCGEGGIVLTNDAALAERVALVRNHAESVVPDWGRYDNADIVGYNYRLTELQAAVAIPQLARIDELNAWRARLANALTARLDGCGWFLPAQVRADCQHVYYLYPLLLQPEVAGVRRDTVLAALKAEGVHASAYVPPLYRLPIFARHAEPEAQAYARLFPLAAGPGWSEHCCPVVERVEDHQMIVTNICRPPLGEAEIDEFVAAIDKVTTEVDALRAWERAQAG